MQTVLKLGREWANDYVPPAQGHARDGTVKKLSPLGGGLWCVYTQGTVWCKRLLGVYF